MGIAAPIYLFSKTPYPGVCHIPLLVTRYIPLSADFDCYDMIIATSKTVFEALKSSGDAWKALPVLAVSEATAKAARAAGAKEVVTAGGYGADIKAYIMNNCIKMRLLYPRAAVVATDFAQELAAQGVAIDAPVVYETECDASVIPEALEPDAVLIFTSPSAVRCFLKRRDFAPSQKLVAIGTTTRAVFDERTVVHMPASPSLEEAVALARRLREE